jgi:hypothetical protein
MGLASIQSQIKSLELQLQLLKAKVQKLEQTTPTHSFGDLCGILKGQVESTEEEIDAVIYRMPPELEE